MKIAHAIRVAEGLVGTGPARGQLVGPLDAEQILAVQALVHFAKQVRAARPAIRQLANVVDPETHSNQQVLFEEPAGAESNEE
jgi:hypothetical protein